MKKVLFAIFLLFCVHENYGQDLGNKNENLKDTCIEGVVIHLTNAKTIYFIEHTKDSTGIVYVFYPNASIREMHYYKRDTIRKSVGWHQKGFKSYEYLYVNGKIEGQVKRYYETGELCCLENYKGGFMDGKQFFYNKKGKVNNIIVYSNGEIIKGKYLD